MKGIRKGVAVPTPNPADDGIYHLIPMPGDLLNRLAKRMTIITYLSDSKGKVIFNQKGKPIPQFEKNDDAIIDEAMKWCPKISNVGVIEADGTIVPVVDQEGRAALVAKGASPEDAAHAVPAGTIVGDELRRQIFREYMELEVDVAEGEKPEGDAGDHATGSEPQGDKAVPKKRKVAMLVAEWVINTSSELGQAKKQEAEKNS